MSDSEKLTRHPAYRLANHDRRRWLMLTFQASQWTGGQTPASSIKFVSPHSVHTLCDRAFAAGPDGAWEIAWCLDVIGLGGFPRPAFSGLLTRLVRSPIDRQLYGRGPIRESQVSFFAGMVDQLMLMYPDKMVEWFIDMNRGNRVANLESQPSTLMRGLLFASAVHHAIHNSFWTSAAGQEGFPARVFSDPCHPDDGLILSAFFVRSFAEFFSWCPDCALERFVAQIRDQADFKAIRIPDQFGVMSLVKVVRADDKERADLRRLVVAAIPREARRRRVAEIMFPPADDSSSSEIRKRPALAG